MRGRAVTAGTTRPGSRRLRERPSVKFSRERQLRPKTAPHRLFAQGSWARRCALGTLLVVASAQAQAADPDDTTPSSTATANTGDEALLRVNRELDNPISTTTNLNLRTTTYWLSIVENRTQRVEQTIELEPLFPLQLTDFLWFMT